MKTFMIEYDNYDKMIITPTKKKAEIVIHTDFEKFGILPPNVGNLGMKEAIEAGFILTNCVVLKAERVD